MIVQALAQNTPSSPDEIISDVIINGACLKLSLWTWESKPQLIWHILTAAICTHCTYSRGIKHRFCITQVPD
jgi:hypothetical protein